MSRRRWLWLLLALPLLAGLARLRFDVEVLNLLPSTLPAVRGLQLHQRHFANARELLITLRGDDAEQVATVARTLAAHLATQPALVRSARWQPPWQENPADAAENLAWVWLQQPPAELARLTARLAPTNVAAELAATREALASSLNPKELARRSYDPLGLTRLPGAAAGGLPGFDNGTGIFTDADGTYRVVFVEPAKAQMNYREATAWFAAIRREADTAFASFPIRNPSLVISFTGGPAFLAEIAGGMESDLRSSVLSTIAVIAVLFWLAHRSWRPLGWLVVSLGLTLGLTLALGGLIFGTLNVVSLGFAAILMGLAVDYGLVAYQEARDRAPEGVDTATLSRHVRREVAPGIGYSATTTAGTFLLLGGAGLPGLAQMGVLTALGLVIGAVVMLWFFLPRVINVAQASRLRFSKAADAGRTAESHPSDPSIRRQARRLSYVVPTLVLVAFVLVAFAWRGIPRLTASTEPLRPRQSPAYAAMDEMKSRLGRTNEPLWLVFTGADELAVGRQLAAAETALSAAQARGEIASFNLPATFWPHPDHAAANRATVEALAGRAAEFRAAAETAGFTASSLALTDGILAAWRTRGGVRAASAWPTNATADWLTSQFAARTPDGGWLALGLAEGAPGFRPENLGLPAGVIPTSWDSLGSALLHHVSHRVVWLTALIGSVLVGCLCLAFRRWQEVALSFAALALSFALLVGVMALLGWSWNLLNLVALPLLLGSSVDSTIHVQLALRRDARGRRREEAVGQPWRPDPPRHLGGHIGHALRSTRRALLLCAGANIAGFGSLAWSNNAGLASLDLVCAVGVGCVFIVCGGLLPLWWRALCGNTELGARSGEPKNPSKEDFAPVIANVGGQASSLPRPNGFPARSLWSAFSAGWKPAEPGRLEACPPSQVEPQPGPGKVGPRVSPVSATEHTSPSKPSALYGARLWRAGGWLGRTSPEPLCVALAQGVATLYRLARPARFAVVVENLLPLCDGDRAAATRTAKANFANFARKLIDLWRHEAGIPLGDRVQVGDGWEHFESLTGSGRGVLLVTPHLGNWEFGAPLLARRGVKLLVLTAPEPGDGFTELRAAARKRLGIETLVVGEDPFAFVEVIRRLQAGGVVALLVDRPPPASAVEVEFLGRPFLASIAAAELARATGCAVLPVFIVREGDGHIAHTLTVVDYDRRELGDREARARFSGRILRAFEPAVRRFAAQWFHFVPIWPVCMPTNRGEKERA